MLFLVYLQCVNIADANELIFYASYNIFFFIINRKFSVLGSKS